MRNPRPERRRCHVLRLNWGTVPDHVIPAWVAEMDYALAPVVHEALRRALHDGITGYPVFDDARELGEAYAGFAARHVGWSVDPDRRCRCGSGGDLPGARRARLGHRDPAAVVLERGRAQLALGHDHHPGLDGHVRLNTATSPDRLREVVRRLAAAWSPAA